MRTDGQTDGRAIMKKLTVAFRNFANALKIIYSFKDETQTVLFKDPVRTAL